VKTMVTIGVITVLAWLINEFQPAGAAYLGNFYATMVVVSGCYALRTVWEEWPLAESGYPAIFLIMVCGYVVDETTDWNYPAIVLNVDLALGFILYNWCHSSDSANKYLGAVLMAKALWGVTYLVTEVIPIGIYAMVLNFLSIIAWVWFADLAIRRWRYLTGRTEEDKDIFYLKTIWQTCRKLSTGI